jgi:hypothetical protein
MRCKEGGKQEGTIPALGWASIAGLTVTALIWEYILSWFLFFSPGWANGWPFGVRFQTVLSVAVTGWISLMVMTAAAAAGAMVSFICSLLGLGAKHGRRAYRMWLWISGGLILCLSIPLLGCIHAWTMEVFPNGYLIP